MTSQFSEKCVRLDPTSAAWRRRRVDNLRVGTGYGHIAIISEDLDATLALLAEQGIEPEKPPYSVREAATGSRL